MFTYKNYLWNCIQLNTIMRMAHLGVSTGPWDFALWACHLLIFSLFFFFVVVQVQLSPFTFHYSPLPQPSALPILILPPFGFVHVSFIHVLETLSPFPPIIRCHLPSGSCQFVLNFNVSGYMLLARLLCWLDSSYSWDWQITFDTNTDTGSSLPSGASCLLLLSLPSREPSIQ